MNRSIVPCDFMSIVPFSWNTGLPFLVASCVLPNVIVDSGYFISRKVLAFC